jgi:hypothetical protein
MWEKNQMSFFAVLRDGSEDNFDVIACHLNLWSIGGLLGHKVFLFDVGLRLKNKHEKDLTKVRLAIPFGTDKESLEDLHDMLLNQSAARLIFGRPVKIDGSKIDYDTGVQIPVAAVSSGESELKTEFSDSRRGYSLWAIKISPAIKNDEECYLRVRFEIYNLGRTWIWKRSGLVKTGALVDLRVADVRQAVSKWNVLEDQIVPIQGINVFVISPASLQFRATSPSCHYMRLLEGTVWEPYLRRKSGMRPGKLVIYEWRNKKDSVIDSADPFRVLLDLSYEFGLLPPSNHLLTAGLVLIALVAAYYVLHHVEELMQFALAALSALPPLTAGTVIAIILWLARGYGPIKATVNLAKKLFRRLERYVTRP